MKGKITIESNIEEREFIEHLLNSRFSGTPENTITLFLAFHAMANGWKIDKLIHYSNLLQLRRI